MLEAPTCGYSCDSSELHKNLPADKVIFRLGQRPGRGGWPFFLNAVALSRLINMDAQSAFFFLAVEIPVDQCLSVTHTNSGLAFAGR